jgi:ABC-2 type transport system ATP-binding protein
MPYALETDNLGKRYGRHWALRNCTLQIPQGCVTGLIGLNGAGKTTLLLLATGLLKPTEGTIHVLGKSSLNAATILPHLGFVSQESSLYRDFSIGDTLMMGKKLNPSWDDTLASKLIERLNLSRKQRIGKLSGGQQAQVALIMALAKKPALLLLDEPFAHVDPLVKRELSKILMETAAEQSITIVLSSHTISDLENICDHLIILAAARVKLAESIEDLLESHKLLIGPRESFESLARQHRVIQVSHTGRQSTALIRTTLPITDPVWQVQNASLEDIALAYLSAQDGPHNQQLSAQLAKEVVQ